MAGLYLHIPFCDQACHYCDFHFSTNRGQSVEMTSAICQELILQKNYLQGERLETVYFGGGTPSLLEIGQLQQLKEAIFNNYQVSADAEITLEANPEDLSPSKLADLKAMGINRLSIGIQSFDNNILKFLNRNHSAEQAMQSVQMARMAGINNISIDLIFAIPGQSTATLIENADNAIALQPDHISAYSLTIEPKTVFGNWSSKGKLQPTADDIAASEMKTLVSRLVNAGYEQYEVSNFCKPGYMSRHNSSYWKQLPYLGVGPSAHSYNGVSRQFNVRHNQAYLRSIEKSIVPAEKEDLTREDRINEYLLTTLRTSWGCDIEKLKLLYDYNVLAENESYITKLLNEQLMTVENNFLKLTPSGRLVADRISSDLFVV